jgi:hypothetical protein
MKKNIDATGLSSSLLNIIRKKGVTVEELNKKAGLIFKKDVKEYLDLMIYGIVIE